MLVERSSWVSEVHDYLCCFRRLNLRIHIQLAMNSWQLMVEWVTPKLQGLGFWNRLVFLLVAVVAAADVAVVGETFVFVPQSTVEYPQVDCLHKF